VPYEKGFNFLFYLENILGEENFAVLLKEWLKKYAQITADSEDWKRVRVFFLFPFENIICFLFWKIYADCQLRGLDEGASLFLKI
jgi:hypothetical protein